MNAVIYARFSSHRQQEQSIDGQIRACTEYAEKHGYTIVRSYCDRATSGTTDERPQFQQMIADAKKHQFGFILVWKLDRFSRNRYDSAIYKRELQKHGVRVLSVTEGIGEGDESIILEALIEAMAEQYSLSLARNVKRGMRESARKGQSVGGHTLFGYRIENKRYVPDPDNAPVVKRIFENYSKGKTKAELCRELNAEGIKIKGKNWTFQAIDRLLRNEKYTGTFTFEDISFEVEPIVDKSLFIVCQKRQATAPKHVRGKADYFLAGKVFCGYCGKALAGSSAQGRNDIYRYYVCNCGKKREPKAFLEQYATEQSCNYVLNPENTEYIAERITDQYNRDFDPARIKAAKSRLNAIEKQQTALMDKYISDDEKVARMAKKRFDELSEEYDAIAETLVELEAVKPLQAWDVRDYLSQFCTGDPTDPAFQKKIINAIVNCLYVWDDKLLIYYNVKQNGDRVDHAQAAVDAEFCSNSNLVYRKNNTTNRVCFRGQYVIVLCAR